MTDRLSLVIGGSGGIGSAISRRLAADGHTVIVGYAKNEEAARDLVVELGGAPHKAVQVDVTDPASLAELAALIAGDSDHLDVLVNCGGVTRPVPHDDLDGLDDEVIDWIFQVNWRGPFAAIRSLRPLLEAAEDGVVVNISSVAAVTGIGSNVAYCASKAALDSLARSLGRSLGPSIRVVSVSPGWVLGEYAKSFPKEYLQSQMDATPLEKFSTGDDVAAAVSAVVHDLKMTTGAIIPVDGGRPLGQ